MGKGEIARYEQFLLSHIVFKRFVLQTRKNRGLFGKGLSEMFKMKAYVEGAGLAFVRGANARN